MTTPRLLIIPLVIGLLAFCAGCDEAEEALNNIPDPGDDPAVQLVTAEGVQMATALVAALPEIATTDFGAKSIEDAYYDETCGCWFWFVGEGNENTTPYWYRQTMFQATFLSGDTPQRESAGADKVAMVITYSYEWSDYGGETYSSKSVLITQNLEITGLETDPAAIGTNGFKLGPLAVDGTGTGHVSGGTGGTGDDGEWDGFFVEFDTAVDMTVPVPGCPTGFLDLENEDATFHMGFNGTTSASWTYKLGGNTVDSGTFPLTCGIPGN